MRKLEIITGRVKKNYKPDQQVLAHALAKKIYSADFLSKKSVEGYARKHHEEFMKMLYLEIRFCNALENFGDSHTAEGIETNFNFVSIILEMLQLITPRELLWMFPPEKRYDGAKYQMKDYFTTMEAVRKLDMDSMIADEKALLDLLWDYQNWEINEFMVSWMGAVSRMRQLQGGMDPLEEFMQKEGIPTYTYHEKEGYLYNRMTGDTVKVEKPKRRPPKYYKTVNGGNETCQEYQE